MRRKIVAGNWKLHGSRQFATDLRGTGSCPVGAVRSTTYGGHCFEHGTGTFDITDALHLTVGGRYNKEKREFRNRWFFLVQPREFTCPGVDVTGTFIECKSTDNVFTPMASLAYDISDDVMVYASYSKGFKGGGFDPRGSGTSAPISSPLT